MQELKSEMKNRIKTLERSIERCEAERERTLTQLTQVDEQINEEKVLVEQYRDALARLSDPIAVVHMPDSVSQEQVAQVHCALKAGGPPFTA